MRNKSPNELFNKINPNSTALQIFTDGSKNQSEKSVGTAVICPDLNVTFTRSITPHASIYTAECLAICDAMDIALQNKNTNVNIYSDSLSALQNLSIPQMSFKVNDYILQIKKKIAEFYKNNIHDTCLKFTWIPAHKGIKGNEIADDLAKEATKKENTQQLVPFSDMKLLFKRIAIHASRNVIKKQGESKGKLYF